jgi:serine/threonine protein kinase/Tol biopolymer transport system component
MTPSRFRQIESLYHALRQRAAGERAMILEQACLGDPELRREVESLLAQDVSGANTINQPIWVPATQTDLASSSVKVFETGSEIGSYKIRGQIGTGGMGVVYQALDTKLGRPVAVKLLSDRLADAAARRRFQREAQTASSLNHPHILTVYDAGEIEGRQYLVTEYVDGGTLREWSRSTERSWREVLDLLTGVADGLAAAHEAKILHRDIKPANILVLKSGYAKLADFGLAKLAEELPGPTDRTKSLTNTQPGMVVGTIAYMSPEQAQGKALDARSDIFSFGVVLYELLAAVRPFDGRNDLETLQNVIHGAPQPLGEQIPAPLRAAVEKALQKDPGERYQSMREMVGDLRALTRTTGEASKPRRRTVLRYSAAGAALLVAAAAVAWYLRAPKGPVTIPSEFVQLTNFSDYATAPAISRDGTMVAFFRGGNYFLGTGQVYVKLLSSGESKQLTDDPNRKYGPVFTPDGSRVAYALINEAARAWETRTVPVLGGPPSRLMQNAAGLSWLGPGRILFSEIMAGTALHMGVVTAHENRAEERAIYFPAHERSMAHYSYPSPDQRSLLIVEMDSRQDWQRCRLVPMDGTSSGAQVGPQGACTAAGWSPDGKWMYFNVEVSGGSHLWRQRSPDGLPEQITFGPTEEEGLAVSPDGKSLIASIGARQRSVWLRDSTGDHRLPVEGSASQPAFSVDGRQLYYLLKSANSADLNELWARDVASGESSAVLTGQKILDYSISPDQKNVAFTVRTGNATAIFIAPVDRGSAPHLLTKNGDSVSFAGPTEVVFRESGEKAAYLARIHNDGTGLERVVEAPIAGTTGASPDGEWAAATGLIGPGRTPTTYAISLRDGSRRILCTGPCAVKWPLDGKVLFLTIDRVASDEKTSPNSSGQTMVVPLPRGLAGATIPEGGFSGPFDQEKLPDGIRLINRGPIAPGVDAGTYAYTQAEFQGNLFRIPLH